jgi:hypothetical protein
MQGELVQALLKRRAHICARWAALLHIERANSALAHPDTLIHLLDWTCDSIIHALEERTPLSIKTTLSRPECPCGRNPYLYFFIASEQAWLEALVFIQFAIPKLDPVDRDEAVAELLLVIRTLAQTEVESFCSVCQYRNEALATAKIATHK